MTPIQAIELAKLCVSGDMASSADFCAMQAEKCLENGNFKACFMWVKKSISYSCGVFSQQYRQVSEAQ